MRVEERKAKYKVSPTSLSIEEHPPWISTLRSIDLCVSSLTLTRAVGRTDVGSVTST